MSDITTPPEAGEVNGSTTSMRIAKFLEVALKKKEQWIIEERDRTFALMLARAEAAEAEIDRLRAVNSLMAMAFPSDAEAKHAEEWLAANPEAPLTDYPKARQDEFATLRADNDRLRAALEEIKSLGVQKKGSASYAMASIARAALGEST